MLRREDVFEEVSGYAKPPLPPLPSLDDLEDLERHGFVTMTPAARRVLRLALRAAGYEAFHASLPSEVEELLRRTNMREGRLFGPAYSATVALADDPRALPALERAATLVVAASELARDVLSGALPQDELKGQPLEMGQYPNLFGTSLRVVNGRGRLTKTTRLDRVAVMVRGRIFTLHVGEPGEATAPRILEALRAIVARAERWPRLREDEAAGILSAGDEKTLKSALAKLEGDATSARALEALRECFVVLCLDLDAAPRTAADAALLTQAANPANRWYLASLQLVVFGDGKAGGICSFPAYLDGNVMMRAAAELQRRAARAPLEAPPGPPLPVATALGFRVDRRLARRAWKDVRRIQDRQRATFELEGVGRAAFEERGLDPVGAFVVALALATRRCSGALPDVLQLVTVSKYRCVPVGGAVVSTPEVRRFLDHVDSGGADERGAEVLAEAVASQARETRAERRKLSLRWTVEGFVRSRRGLARAKALGVGMAAALGLAATGALRRERIILSHPEIFPEVELLGRPGVRLPYVSHYGLHYQMFRERTVMTFMPGLAWTIPNAELAREIERALWRLLEIADAAPRRTAKVGSSPGRPTPSPRAP